MEKILLVLILCCTFTGSSWIQSREEPAAAEIRLEKVQDPLEFDQDRIRELKNDPAFDYRREADDNWWTTFKRYIRLKWQAFVNWLFGEYQPGGILLFILNILPYLVIMAVLAFAVWLFAKLNPGGGIPESQDRGKVLFQEEEKIIASEDISTLIEKAFSGEDYRLALRYHFLLILRQLDLKSIVEYEFSKTDREYTSEIKSPLLAEHFSRLSRIYNYVWYGRFEPSPEDYHRAEKEFHKMQELILQSNE